MLSENKPDTERQTLCSPTYLWDLTELRLEKQ
jgi:hypothetical protein